MRTLSLPLVALLICPTLHAQDKPAKSRTDADVRKAVERSLPFIEKEGLGWWERRKCNGCHHGGYLLWSHNEAKRSGFAVDDKKLEDWNAQAVKFFSKDLKDFKTKKSGFVEGGGILLGQVAAPASKSQDSLKSITEIVVNGQQADGFWKYEGQGLKRSEPENNEATSLWMILALATVEKSNPAAAKSREQALAWSKKTLTGSSNEALVLRILIEDQFGDRELAKKMLLDLKNQQNPDGGWSWTKERPSEAFATGQSLYALGRMGLTGSDANVQRAWAFLLAKQKEDGSWPSPSRKPNVAENAIAHFWGTAWATIGLVRTLGK